MNYTDIVDGIQIRDVTHIGLPPPGTPPTFDIVKWKDCEPQMVRDLTTGEYKTMTRYCWSIANLEWDRHEGWWKFHSVGTRWLEANPPVQVVDMILRFCEEKGKELSGDAEPDA